MQLILETEPTLNIRGDMSVVEGSLDEKFVGNGECGIDLKNTEYSIGNLEDSSNSKSSTDTVNVNNDSNLDSDLKKTLDGGDVMLLDNRETFVNNGCDSVDSTCANDGNNDIQELHKDELTNDEALEDPISKQTNSEYEEQVCAVEDNIDRIKDSHIDEAEAMDVPDTENTVEEVNKTECNLIDSSLINENNTVLRSEITAMATQPTENKDNALNSPQNITEQNIVNEISPCHDSDTSEEKLQSIEFNTNIDIERPESIKIEEKSTNDISEIPELSKEVEESVPMETKDDVNVEEIENVVVQESDITHNTDLNIEVPIAAKEITSATSDIDQETNTDNCIETVIKKDTDTIEVKDEVDIENLKDSVEETKIITCDISSNNSLKESASKDLKDEVFGDDVMCITDAPKMDTYLDKEILNKGTSIPIELNDEIEDIEEVKDVKENTSQADIPNRSPVPPVPVDSPKKPVICKLSNTLDILSDDEEEPPKETQTKVDSQTTEKESTQSQSINIEDDDDIMLIDDVPIESKVNKTLESNENQQAPNPDSKTDQETGEECNKEFDDLMSNSKEKESPPPADTINMDVDIREKPIEKEPEVVKQEKPLLPENFLKSAKKNLADMTREDLEEFCILKIVESIVDRSSLSDIKTKLKTMAQNIEVYRKKAMTLTKQNRDLQVVLKSVQEEQKKMTDLPITPLKITRSVGMQVLMTDKVNARRKPMATPLAPTLNTSNNKQNIRIPAQQTPRTPKPTTSNQSIPVPRLVPANSPAMKSPTPMPPIQPTSAPGKITLPNGIKNQTPQKAPEKRPHNRIQSVTVDLTDDEPPAKLNPRSSPAPPVRLVPPQNLLAPQRQPFPPVVNSPRKVYIPISGPQSQAIRAGQTIMLKPVPGIRPRCAPPQVSRNTTPVRRVTSGRHPAPLPDVMKQYQPPNWKALPPAPDLRLSKVENGIVISWKIEGYQEDSYEEIASYQLYAYQETTSPPSTSLWKKIGDVKALPLPMACTLTQFMAGFKYYFAVRAVDVKSRLGPFSLPGSILLLNKL